jgi:hypothetical protein
VSAYPTPRRIELRVLETDRLTMLEYGRVLAAANVRDGDVAPLLRLVFRKVRDADPGDVLRAMTLVYAIAWQLERRLDPAVTWQDAQAWDVVPLEATPDDYEAARLERSADVLVAKVALGTGLPFEAAGELTLAQVEAMHEARQGATRRQRRARVRR